eukprot:scaffold128082_cov25-Tisochrysis_lutea.AAC.2
MSHRDWIDAACSGANSAGGAASGAGAGEGAGAGAGVGVDAGGAGAGTGAGAGAGAGTAAGGKVTAVVQDLALEDELHALRLPPILGANVGGGGQLLHLADQHIGRRLDREEREKVTEGGRKGEEAGRRRRG